MTTPDETGPAAVGTAAIGGAALGGPAGALIAAAGAEALYAWYDPDFFTKGVWVHAGTDETVETLNNYWQNLWRSATESGLTRQDPVMKVLDRDMGAFVDFKRRYDDRIFARAADPFAIWGAQADFEQELKTVWIPRFETDLAQFVAADPRIQRGLADRGVDVASLKERTGARQSGLGWQFWAGAGAVIALIGTGVFLARR